MSATAEHGHGTPGASGLANPDGDVPALKRRIQKLTSLLDVAKAMTVERHLDSLLNLILSEATRVINADRCTIWLVDRDRSEIWTRVAQGLERQVLRMPVGKGIAGQVAATGDTINIADAYKDARFNPDMDKRSGYHTRNTLAVAMFSTTGEVSGVLQALNKTNGEPHFTQEDDEILLALGANAAAAIENAILYEEIDGLFAGLVKASVVAIESRDPTTSGHSSRVADLSCRLAECVDRSDMGPYRDLTVTPNDLRELRYAALLHDFGKVGVRENVLVKAKKLYPGEIESIRVRFSALLAQRENKLLRQAVDTLLAGKPLASAIDGLIARERETLEGFLRFVEACNEPTVLESGGFDRLREIATLSYDLHRGSAPVLTEHELERLAIPRGTLDQAERLEIESHVTHTFRFLVQIPWTRQLKRVPEIAYAHHEKLDGSGYPRRLTHDEIPVQSKMMTIADIYDALTASDRPYKKAVPHAKALDILKDESKRGKIDNDLLTIFIEGDVQRVLQASV